MYLYGLVIFVGAFLLFQVQLILARYLLPWFGGAANVWNTSMLFFQGMLVVGYCYAHLLTTHHRSRKGMVCFHLVVVGVALAVPLVQILVWGSPLLPGEGLRLAEHEHPSLRVLFLLLISAGPPFLLLASTSSLIQFWFGEIWPGSSPYRLYALSNAGSLLGLLSYPFATEPFFGLRAQSFLWAGCFLVFCLLYGLAAWRFLGKAPTHADAPSDRGPLPGAWVRILWIVLPAIGTVLLLATTNKITEKIAVIPLFWVLALAVYLATYILAFDGKIYGRMKPLWTGLTVVVLAVLAVIVGLAGMIVIDELVMLGGYLLILFVGCMHCHGELHRLKPPTTHLTAYYLSMAAGGALGGAIVSLLAPVLSTQVWEFLLGLLACSVFVTLAKLTGRAGMPAKQRGLVLVGGAAPAMLVLCLIVAQGLEASQFLYRGRNFYGTFYVREAGLTLQQGEDVQELTARKLVHGTTHHGYQVQGDLYRRMPTSYFAPDSGVGLALVRHPRAMDDSGETFEVGVLGLGVGTLATYGKAHHRFRIYEIDPDIAELSTGPDPLFSFIADSAAPVEMVIGDARISMEREIEQGHSHRYDLLILDAFTSDQLPTHLITLDAFRVYLKLLKPGGILAVHFSSRSFVLEPLIVTQARESGLNYVKVETLDNPATPMLFGSDWMLLSEDTGILDEVAAPTWRSETGPEYRQVRPWTDDYSNPMQLLKIGDQSPFLKVFGAASE